MNIFDVPLPFIRGDGSSWTHILLLH